jgi:hypothetical protein
MDIHHNRFEDEKYKRKNETFCYHIIILADRGIDSSTARWALIEIVPFEILE